MYRDHVDDHAPLLYQEGGAGVGVDGGGADVEAHGVESVILMSEQLCLEIYNEILKVSSVTTHGTSSVSYQTWFDSSQSHW
jgi:hypothetical protein